MPGTSAQAVALLPVDAGKLVAGVLRVEDHAQPRRSPGGCRGATAVQQRHAPGGVGAGRDPDGATVVLERLTGEGLPQDAQVGLHALAALRPVHAGVDVLLRPVAQAADVGDPAPGDQVGDDHVLGQSHRVVQGHQQGRDDDRDALRARGGGRGQRDRGRQVAVVDIVVFGQDQRVDAAGIRQRGLVEEGRVQLVAGHRRDAVGHRRS
jgi:hypothetical protein